MRRADRSLQARPVITGNDRVATAPAPSPFFNVTRPRCSSAISFTNESPRPVLFLAVAGRASE